MHRRTFVLSSIGITSIFAGCTGGESNESDGDSDLSQEATVEISDGAFDPLHVEIAPGGTVTWENGGDESYRIDSFQFHAGSAGWDFNKTVEPGESVSHTFQEEGRYDFTDQNHGQFSMCGRVKVGDVEEGESLPCE